jgi:peptide-N4-(N-acetyl-beta-glucosaminyl)asparagine amidase
MNLTGWGRKLGYCIAFSRDGAADVTRRYARNLQHWSQERTRCSESTLIYILDEIRAMRRKDMSKQEKFKLKGEDIREEYELSTIVAKTLVVELCRTLLKNGTEPPKPTPQSIIDADAQKVQEARQEAEANARRGIGQQGGRPAGTGGPSLHDGSGQHPHGHSHQHQHQHQHPGPR